MTATVDQATKNAKIVYDRLLKQGRPEADARRDAERWVLGNNGVEVTLPAPAAPPRRSFLDDLITNASAAAGEPWGYVWASTPPRPSMRRCPTCSQPWPFIGECGNCQRRRWTVWMAGTRAKREHVPSDATLLLRAERNRDRSYREWEDIRIRKQDGDPLVSNWNIEFAKNKFEQHEAEYVRVCEDIAARARRTA